MKPVRTNRALQVTKARGVVLGNPQLALQRNRDATMPAHIE